MGAYQLLNHGNQDIAFPGGKALIVKKLRESVRKLIGESGNIAFCFHYFFIQPDEPLYLLIGGVGLTGHGLIVGHLDGSKLEGFKPEPIPVFINQAAQDSLDFLTGHLGEALAESVVTGFLNFHTAVRTGEFPCKGLTGEVLNFVQNGFGKCFCVQIAMTFPDSFQQVVQRRALRNTEGIVTAYHLVSVVELFQIGAPFAELFRIFVDLLCQKCRNLRLPLLNQRRGLHMAVNLAICGGRGFQRPYLQFFQQNFVGDQSSFRIDFENLCQIIVHLLILQRCIADGFKEEAGQLLVILFL